MQKMKVVGQTVQLGERKQTDRRTDGRYQVHYLHRFAVDNNLYYVRKWSNLMWSNIFLVEVATHFDHQSFDKSKTFQ